MVKINQLFSTLIDKFFFKKIRDFNVENRAMKLLKKNDKRAAPKYQADIKSFDRILKEYPKLAEIIDKKDEKLIKLINQIKITEKVTENNSASNAIIKNKNNENLNSIVYDIFGNIDVKNVPENKINLKMLAEIFDAYHFDEMGLDEIALKFNLDIEDLDDLLNYFAPFRTFEADKGKIVNKFSYFDLRMIEHLAKLADYDLTTMDKKPVDSTELDLSNPIYPKNYKKLE